MKHSVMPLCGEEAVSGQTWAECRADNVNVGKLFAEYCQVNI